MSGILRNEWDIEKLRESKLSRNELGVFYCVLYNYSLEVKVILYRKPLCQGLLIPLCQGLLIPLCQGLSQGLLIPLCQGLFYL